MERARLQGKHIGRPRVIDQEGFLQRLQTTVNRIAEGVISRRQAARELGIGYATIKRLLDANFNSLQEKQDEDDRQHSVTAQSAPEERLLMVCP